uniref:hypothetical protein n=1 Tax=Herbidospora sakaeratensis TaxID=564415 RepID=UPI00078489E9|nr:hypothetical protein [Herbidospora sakaeratensis]
MSERLIRTSYVDPTVNPPEPRQGDTGLHESRQDQEGYAGPLHRMAGAALHRPGVAEGLGVSATVGQAGLRVLPGVALDVRGRLIPLATGGHARLGDGTMTEMGEQGLVLPTQGPAGERTVTIAWAETFDFTGVGAGVFATETTPVLRLRGPGQVSAEEVVLAEVRLGADGTVADLTAGTRRAVGGAKDRIELVLPGAVRSGALAVVGEAQAGELRALREGGLALEARRLTVRLPGGGEPALSVDPVARRVGIGTGQPEAALDTAGTAVFRERVGIGTGQPEAALDTAGTAVFRERVGVGTAAPAAALDVAGHAVVRDRLGVGRTPALGRVHAVDVGGFGTEDDFGRSVDTNVPLLAQADSTAFGILNADRRPAFAINIDFNEGVTWARGIPTLYDRYDGTWRPGLALRNGWVGIGTQSPTSKLDVRTTEQDISAVFASSASRFGVYAMSGTGTGLFAMGQKAAEFYGDVNVIGKLTKSNLQFMIDHPLDPAGRYLNHSAVESDEMKNVYDGEVVLDADGGAEITLPAWFEALNEKLRYQLTPVGRPAPGLHVSRRLADGRFSVAGGEPGTEVCWQVTGVRHDAYARANPLVVETDKDGEEAGRFLHPEPHGEPASRALGALTADLIPGYGTTQE